EREVEAVGGDRVTEAVRDPLDQPVQAEPTQVIGHRTGRVVLQVAAKQAGHQGAQVAMTEAARPWSNLAQRLEQRQYTGIAQAQAGDALATDEPRVLDALDEAGLGDRALGQTLGFQQVSVDLLTHL